MSGLGGGSASSRLDAAPAVSAAAVSPYSVVRVWVEAGSITATYGLYGGRLLPAQATSGDFSLIPGS